MQFHKIITLKDGRTCTLRNGTEQDGQALLDIYQLTHAQTDYLLSYPDESTLTAEQEAQFYFTIFQIRTCRSTANTACLN